MLKAQLAHNSTVHLPYFSSKNCDNNIIRTLAVINKCKLGLFLSKYLIPSINIAVSDIKSHIWKHFVDMAHNSGKYSYVRIHYRTLLVYSVFTVLCVLIRSDCACVVYFYCLVLLRDRGY